MTIQTISALLGILATLIGLIGALVGFCRGITRRVNAVSKGMQAMLRNQMIELWNEYSRKGYVPIYVRDNFENIWKSYHSLGANGVMNGIHNKFMALPVSEYDHDFHGEHHDHRNETK